MTQPPSAPAIGAYPSSDFLPAVAEVHPEAAAAATPAGPSPALIAVGVAGLALAAGVVGVLNPARLVLVDSLLNHPWAVVAVVVAALGAAAFAAPWSQTTKTALVVLAAVIAVGLGPFALPYLVPAAPYQISTSPDGSLEAFTERVALDGRSVWMVGVREADGLSARRWPLGCIGQDRAGRGGVRLTWSEPKTLLITAEKGARARVRAGSNGRPIRISGSTSLLASAPRVGPLPLTMCM